MEDQTTATVIIYDEADYEELNNIPLEAIGSLLAPGKVLWIRMKRLVSDGELQMIGTWTGLDKIDRNTILEHVKGDPKLIRFEGCAFLSWRYAEHAENKIEERVVHIIIGDGFVVSFEQNQEDIDFVKDLIIKETRIRKMPASFLLYSILDTTIDDFFDYTRYLGRRIDDLQEEVVSTSKEVIGELLQLRQELTSLWLSIWNLGEISSALHERKSSLIDDSAKHNFEDLTSRINHLAQMIESTRQVVPQVISLYQNDLTNQLSKVVRLLTIITVIFTPPVVIATWYGMNFRNIPEVGSDYGYPAVIIVTVVMCVALTIYFWKKKWFAL